MAHQPSMTTEQLLRLPVSVDIVTAGRAFGFGKEKSYELAGTDEFPCKVLRLGKRYCVPKADIFDALGLTADFMMQVARILADLQTQADAA